MSIAHAVEAVLVRGMAAGFRALTPKAARTWGAACGDVAHGLGLRRAVARDNLAHAFPELSPEAREAILSEHYRELGRIVSEFARLPALVRAPGDQVVAGVRGIEHLERGTAAGRGMIMLSGHYCNVELLGAWLGRRHSAAIVVQPLANPGVEAWITRQRREAGLETIPMADIRRVYHALRENKWIGMLADQDARGRGMFVPFLGRPASTTLGPARIALATGAPIVMGFATRRADGRLELDIEPLTAPGDLAEAEAAEQLPRRHVARLEMWIRRRLELWFWLHRRWKTVPRTAPRAEVMHASF